jgi:hypothetical protein
MPVRNRIGRLRRSQFTVEVLSMYCEMRALPCSCGLDPFERSGTCVDCQRWLELHGELLRALPRHRPWHYPLLPRRDEPTPDGWRLRDELEAALAEAEGR